MWWKPSQQQQTLFSFRSCVIKKKQTGKCIVWIPRGFLFTYTVPRSDMKICALGPMHMVQTRHFIHLLTHQQHKFNYFLIFYRNSLKNIPWIWNFFQELFLNNTKKFSTESKFLFCPTLLCIFSANSTPTLRFCFNAWHHSNANNDPKPNTLYYVREFSPICTLMGQSWMFA